jgi:hypothetical protein
MSLRMARRGQSRGDFRVTLSEIFKLMENHTIGGLTGGLAAAGWAAGGTAFARQNVRETSVSRSGTRRA